MSPAAENNSPPVTGTVLWFERRKGYGFVKPDDGGADVFVHVADLAASGMDILAEGERIAFQRSSHGDGRYFATAIRRLAEGD